MSELDERATRRNIAVLTIAQTLGASGGPIIIALGGLIGQSLAPSPALFTLPVFAYTLAMALGTLPAAGLMSWIGRPRAYMIGATLGAAGGLIATSGLFLANFWIFSFGTFLAGLYQSYVQSYRFAATDGVAPNRRARAVSWVMLGGLMAAVIGPQLVILTRNMAEGVPFAGAFVTQGLLAAIAIVVLTQLRPVETHPGKSQATAGEQRTVAHFLREPRYLLAVATGVVSYAMMNLLMTAAPIAMVGCGISIDDATLGIQWHALAMFGPSFFTGRLIERFGAERIAALGLILIAASAAIALRGLEIPDFWGSLIVLGLGWNFGFIGATAMLAKAYHPGERTIAQGLNDFLLFGSVAVASLTSGPAMSFSGWGLLNIIVFPVVAIVLVPLLWGLARGERTSNADDKLD